MSQKSTGQGGERASPGKRRRKPTMLDSFLQGTPQATPRASVSPTLRKGPVTVVDIGSVSPCSPPSPVSQPSQREGDEEEECFSVSEGEGEHLESDVEDEVSGSSFGPGSASESEESVDAWVPPQEVAVPEVKRRQSPVTGKRQPKAKSKAKAKPKARAADVDYLRPEVPADAGPWLREAIERFGLLPPYDTGAGEAGDYDTSVWRPYVIERAALHHRHLEAVSQHARFAATQEKKAAAREQARKQAERRAQYASMGGKGAEQPAPVEEPVKEENPYEPVKWALCVAGEDVPLPDLPSICRECYIDDMEPEVNENEEYYEIAVAKPGEELHCGATAGGPSITAAILGAIEAARKQALKDVKSGKGTKATKDKKILALASVDLPSGRLEWDRLGEALAKSVYVLNYWTNWDCDIYGDIRTTNVTGRVYSPFGTADSVDICYCYHLRRRFTMNGEFYAAVWVMPRDDDETLPADPTAKYRPPLTEPSKYSKQESMLPLYYRPKHKRESTWVKVVNSSKHSKAGPMMAPGSLDKILRPVMLGGGAKKVIGTGTLWAVVAAAGMVDIQCPGLTPVRRWAKTKYKVPHVAKSK
ncbi:hypothetical protein KIPB_011362 [Kipferlia bialata]|uniref:Uncharacterized protein n=1 Tax=Kipferlia bialata TaxID=797122 RepID=A0A391NX11_9EUKA|nr:hypothetical protein KIPB_011362 [Kipferlia bialata]|eukprot:g11362.t1